MTTTTKDKQVEVARRWDSGEMAAPIAQDMGLGSRRVYRWCQVWRAVLLEVPYEAITNREKPSIGQIQILVRSARIAQGGRRRYEGEARSLTHLWGTYPPEGLGPWSEAVILERGCAWAASRS